MTHVGQRESSDQEVRKQRQEDTWKDNAKATKNDDRSMWREKDSEAVVLNTFLEVDKAASGK